MLTKKELKEAIKEIEGTAGGEETISVADAIEILEDFTEKEEIGSDED